VYTVHTHTLYLRVLLNVSLYLFFLSVLIAAFLWMCGTQMYLVAPLESLQGNHNANW